jgi:hypothetical protein
VFQRFWAAFTLLCAEEAVKGGSIPVIVAGYQGEGFICIIL